MKTLHDRGSYLSKKTGHEVSYSFEYAIADGSTPDSKLADLVASVGADKLVRNYERMSKLDANNTAREKAKSANGDSERKVMTVEEKQAKKVEREENKALLELLRSNPSLIAQLKQSR